jgi:hypothetical protein
MTSIEALIQHIKSDIGKIRPTSDYSGGYKQALIDIENMILEMAQLTQQEISDNTPKEVKKDSFGEISDEEIEKASWKYEVRDKFDAYFIREAFIKGCEWYREQLKQL